MGTSVHAQFTTPYDPDFAAPRQEEPKPAPEDPREGQTPSKTPPLEETPIQPAVNLPASGPFLLMDRPDAGRILEPLPEEPAEKDPTDLYKFQEGLKTFEYSEKKYIQARTNIEEGKEPREPGATQYIDNEDVQISTEATPKPPPPEVELPTYGTSLSVTGRKVIGFNFSEKRFTHDQSKTGRPASTNLVTIDQQLQLRMQGKVGPKITINVDYDDTKLNQQDISVVYTGDPDEVVQNVSFGDIDLSLPATEFVSYNKQLFGIRADIKYKGLKASFIGSRTKGTTKTKQFFGNTQFVATDLLDTSYVRRQFYDLTFDNPARMPIQPGSERIFLAQQNPAQSNVNEVTLQVNDLAAQTTTFTGKFTQLQPGQDYTIDYVKGILSFRNALQPQFVVAVDFIDSSGNALSVETSTGNFTPCANNPLSNPPCLNALRLVKTSGDIPIVSTRSEVGFNRELKTVYNIGQTQIVRDNGRGNFILQVLDQQRKDVGSTFDPIQKYPDTIAVDFENGTFRLDRPFSSSTTRGSIPDPDIYSPTPISKRLLHIEYSFRFKTFFLEPNLVVQSEVVLLDGIKLNRNVDYFIDYEAGFITFFNEERIRPQSTIDISFEVAPFAGVTNDSLLGMRVSNDFGKHYTLGSTLLYQAGSKAQTVPSITELSRSLLVYEFDQQIKNVKLFRKLIATSISAELAQSRQNLNLNDFALIDNMEGIKQEETAGLLANQWLIASNPANVPTDGLQPKWLSEDVKVLEINPRAQAGANESQKVLNVPYDFTGAFTDEQSIVFPFSISGVDMSQKTVLEVVMLGDNSQNEINFHLGSINENADGDDTLDTEDVNNDNLLQPAEDVGWLYNPLGKNSTRFGANNGFIDSEDLNRNGRLDPADFTGGDFGYVGDPNNSTNNLLRSITDNADHQRLDFGGWHTFQIPLNISSATASRWTNIKQLRISLRKRVGSPDAGTVKFARIAVVGNTWTRGQAGEPATGAGPVAAETLIVTPINNVDNPGYAPIFNSGGEATQVFNDLYGSISALQKQSSSKNISEQALALDFKNLTIGAGGVEPVLSTKRTFPRAIDISQHKFLNFLVFGNADSNPGFNANDHTFFLRAGNDTNFFEVRVPLNFSGWKKVRVEQIDRNGDSIADAWRSVTPGTVVISSGAASLQAVGQLQAGVRRNAAGAGLTAAGTLTSGRAYLNEIHVSQPVIRVGTAVKLDMNFEVPGWATFGAKHRSVDRNFQTPTSVVSNQDNKQDNAYLNFTRLSYLPMTFNLSRAITETPSTSQTGDLSNIVNILQTGKVTTWNGSASANFTLGAYPRIGLSHTRSRIEYEVLTRLDDRKSWSTSLQYGVPLATRFAPKTIDINAGFSQYDVTFDALRARKITGNFNTHELTTNFGTRLTFIPWEGSAFNPSYSLTKVSEKRSDFTGAVEKHFAYPKSLAEKVDVSSNYKLLRWLNPQVNYTVDILENNNTVSTSTFFVGASTLVFPIGGIKTVNRSANGSISLPITIGEITGRTKLFRTLNIISGYQTQDGDVWNNVESQLNTMGALWVRTPLRPTSPVAQRVTQTLRDTFNSTQRWSPLDAYTISGRLASFRTLNLSNNYIRSLQRADTTGTLTKTVSTTFPDIVASLGQMEQLLFTERWMTNTQMNFKYSAHKTENIGTSLNTDNAFGTDLRSIIRKRFDTLVSYNTRNSTTKDLRIQANTQKAAHQDATVQVTFDIRKFRFTPKVDYGHDTTQLGTGVKTQDIVTVTPSLLIRADLALPRGLMLPGSKRPLLFTNRIIWTTTMSLAERRSPVTIADNSRLFNLTTSGDYEIAKNLRMTLNGAAARLWHKFLKEEEFISYQFGTTLTFQF